MNEINYWDRFMTTGKIDDFLAYRNAAKEAQTQRLGNPGGAGEHSGEHSHAGVYTDYGDGFKD